MPQQSPSSSGMLKQLATLAVLMSSHNRVMAQSSDFKITDCNQLNLTFHGTATVEDLRITYHMTNGISPSAFDNVDSKNSQHNYYVKGVPGLDPQEASLTLIFCEGSNAPFITPAMLATNFWGATNLTLPIEACFQNSQTDDAQVILDAKSVTYEGLGLGSELPWQNWTLNYAANGSVQMHAQRSVSHAGPGDELLPTWNETFTRQFTIDGQQQSTVSQQCPLAFTQLSEWLALAAGVMIAGGAGIYACVKGGCFASQSSNNDYKMADPSGDIPNLGDQNKSSKKSCWPCSR